MSFEYPDLAIKPDLAPNKNSDEECQQKVENLWKVLNGSDIKLIGSQPARERAKLIM